MRNFTLGLLECTAMASIVILAVLLARAALGRKLTAAALLALWALALARMLLPMALPSPVHLDALLPRPVSVLAAMPGTAMAEQPAAPAARAGNNTSVTPSSPALQPSGLSPYPAGASAPGRSWRPMDPWAWGAAIWAAGALATVLLAALHGRRLNRAVRLCPPLSHGPIVDQVNALRAELGVRRPVKVLRCDFAPAPMVYGLRRPALLLPPQYASADASALRGVLLHELAHIRRGDLLQERLWLLARAIHWFNPLVHLACRLRRDDAELACDALALRRMDAPARLHYGEMLLAAAREQNSRHLRTAAALLGGSGIGQRLRALALPRQTSPSAAALSAVLALVMIVGCFTTACQPTPSKPAVISKNDGKLEEKLKETAPPAAVASGAPGAPTLRSRMSIPETWQDEKTSEDGKVRLSIDAKIEMPDVAKAAVYKAKVAPFTVEQLKTVQQVLLGGVQLIDPSTLLTREYWQQQMVETQQYISQAKKDGAEEFQRKLEESLAYMQEQYAKTPETIENIPVELAFLQESEGAKVFRGAAAVGGRAMAVFAANSANTNYATLNVGLTTSDNPQFPLVFQERPDMDAPADVRMTREQARQQAEQWVAQLDPNLRVVSVEPGSDTTKADKIIWMVTFARTYDGMTSLDNDHYISMEDEQANMPAYEKIELGLDDSGFAYLNWSVPLAATETVNQDAALMDYPQIQQAAAKAAIRYGQGRVAAVQKNQKNIKSCSVKVERLVLGLTRVAQKDKPGEFLLVPSWNVYGYDELDGAAQKEGYKPMAFVVATINALDGSIIDTAKGY